MRDLSTQEVTAVSGGTLGLLSLFLGKPKKICAPKPRCTPKPVCKPKPRCAPKPRCGEEEAPEEEEEVIIG